MHVSNSGVKLMALILAMGKLDNFWDLGSKITLKSPLFCKNLQISIILEAGFSHLNVLYIILLCSTYIIYNNLHLQYIIKKMPNRE